MMPDEPNPLDLHLADAKRCVDECRPSELYTAPANVKIADLWYGLMYTLYALQAASERIKALERLTAPCEWCQGKGMNHPLSTAHEGAIGSPCNVCGGCGFKRRMTP